MCVHSCVCVCVHLDSLNAEHKFRVWILGHTSHYLHFHSSTEVLNHSGLYKEPGPSRRDGPARIRPNRNPGGWPGRDWWDEPGRLQPNKDPGGRGPWMVPAGREAWAAPAERGAWAAPTGRGASAVPAERGAWAAQGQPPGQQRAL